MGGNDYEHLSYRDLADRLAISPDAARMKAKRKAWRIIPGNHPNAPVLVEVPLTELAERVPRGQARREAPRTPRTASPEQPNNADGRILDALSDAVALLGPAHAQIERLHAQLIEAKDAHHRDAVELAAAEMREMGTKAELERALAEQNDLRQQVTNLRSRLVHERRPLWRRSLGIR